MSDMQRYLQLDSKETKFPYAVHEKLEKTKEGGPREFWTVKYFSWPTCEIDMEMLVDEEAIANGDDEIKVYADEEDKGRYHSNPSLLFRQCPQDPSYLKCMYVERKHINNTVNDHFSWTTRANKGDLVYVKVGTPLSVVYALFKLHKDKDLGLSNTYTRVTIDYGDVNTLGSWGETYGVTGTIGLSTGPRPCFLLIHNSRSMGGGEIMTRHILSIKSSQRQQYTGDRIIHYKHNGKFLGIPMLYKHEEGVEVCI